MKTKNEMVYLDFQDLEETQIQIESVGKVRSKYAFDIELSIYFLQLPLLVIV